MFTEIALTIAALAAFAWLVFSQHTFAVGVRSRVRSFFVKAGDTVSSVEDDTTSALELKAAQKKKGRRTVFDVRREIEEAEMELEAVREELKTDAEDAALALKHKDQAVYVEAKEEEERDLRTEARLLENLEHLYAELKEIQSVVSEINSQEADMRAEARELVSDGRVADLTSEMDKARAGLSETDSGENLMEKARNKVKGKKAEARAARKMATEGATPEEAAQIRLKQYRAEGGKKDYAAEFTALTAEKPEETK